MESALYFSVAEVLANAVKHAAARAVEIRMQHREGVLRIAVTDDGAGGADPARGTGLRGIERMEIHCDEANIASASVPPKLGYRLTARLDHVPEAPGEVGTRLIWVLYRREWESLAVD